MQRPAVSLRFVPNFRVVPLPGETEEEARRNNKEAIELYLEPSEIVLPSGAKFAEVTIG